MADEHDNTSPEEQALADEWAAALAEAGDASQDDIDALLNQGGAPAAAAPAAPRAPLEDSTIRRSPTARSSASKGRTWM